jgi:hypothetical protein
LGRRAAADLRAGDAVFVVFFVVFFIVLAAAPLRTGLFLSEVFAAFFETLFVFAVFFATPCLLKLRYEGYGGHARLYRYDSAWRAGATHRRARSTKAFRSALLAYKMVE